MFHPQLLVILLSWMLQLLAVSIYRMWNLGWAAEPKPLKNKGKWLNNKASYITSESTPLQNSKIEPEGFKYIVGTFGIVTLIITIGLGVTLNQYPGKVPFGSGLASEHTVCSEAGNDVFMKGGNSLDVAVAITFCLGVVLPHLTGIGGNGIILIYNHKAENALMCLDSWPPPGTAALPQLLSALNKAHSEFGYKPWDVVLEPAVRIAREGFLVSKSLMQSYKHLSPVANNDLKSWLGSLKSGAKIKAPKLAETLEIIKENGIEAFYKGSLRQELEKYFDVNNLSELSLNRHPCSEVSIDDYHLITSGFGSVGPILLETLSKFNVSNTTTAQEIADLLGKEELSWPLPSGVVVNVADKDENYVSIVSSSKIFGLYNDNLWLCDALRRQYLPWRWREILGKYEWEKISFSLNGLGPILGSQHLLKNGYVLGSLLHQSNLSKINSIGTPLIVTTAKYKCEKRFITGAVDVRDLLQVVPKLLWNSGDILSSIEAPRARITKSGLFAETMRTPSLPHALGPAPLPYPVISVVQKRGDDVVIYEDSRSL